MSGTVFGSRIRSSVSTFAVAALLAAAPALVVGSASAATTEPTAPSATVTTAPAPKVEQKAETATKAPAKSDVQAPAQTSVQAPAKPTHVQVSNAPKVEVTKTQADAVAKELGAKPTDTLAVQLGQYHEKIEAANALKDSAARTKAVTEARQQLTAIGGKPVTPEQATKIDGILGIKTAPATVQ